MPTRDFLLEQGHTDLCFDDILLTPQYSQLGSRNDPDISVQLGHVKLELPVMSSPMDSITGLDMLVEMGHCGGLGILTRFIDEKYLREVAYALDTPPVESILHVKLIHEAKKRLGNYPVGCAIGIKNGVRKT